MLSAVYHVFGKVASLSQEGCLVAAFAALAVLLANNLRFLYWTVIEPPTIFKSKCGIPSFALR